MTPEEFVDLWERQGRLWPNAKLEAHPDVYEELKDVPYDAARQAIAAALAEGCEFAPGAPGIVGRYMRMIGGEQWTRDQVWRAFESANRCGGFSEISDPLGRERFEREHPSEVTAFISRYYQEYAMSGGPNGDPVTVVRKQLGDLWDGQASRVLRDRARGLTDTGKLPLELKRVDGPKLVESGDVGS